MKKRLTLGILVLALLAGCHTPRHAARPEPAAEPAASEARPQRAYTLMNFEGEVEGISVSGQLRMAEDSAMWLSVNKLVEVARALATTDSVWLAAPLLGYDGALDYAALSRRAGRPLALADLQAIALGDNAEEQVAALARQLGFNVRVRITRRQRVGRLTFPFNTNRRQP